MSANQHNPPPGVDRVFTDTARAARPFAFDADVAAVFEDMLDRSVPIYRELHDLTVRLCERHVPTAATIVDLGCSTGTTMLGIAQAVDADLIGVDYSQPMLDRCGERFAEASLTQPTLICADAGDVDIPPADIVIANLTIQFVAFDKRAPLLRRIRSALRPGGLLILTEKLRAPDPALAELYEDLYVGYKRARGYSEQEIAGKRDALDGVLRPTTEKHLRALCDDAGFRPLDCLLRWVNFALFITAPDPNAA